MSKEELIGKLQMVYVGDKNALNEMIDYYDELFDEMESWREEVKELKKQLDYLRSGEYYNQLRFENEMLQQVVDTNGVPSEVYDYIDCTHRNTELLEENQKYKEVIDRAIKRLEKGIFIIPNDTNELLDILKEVE